MLELFGHLVMISFGCIALIVVSVSFCRDGSSAAQYFTSVCVIIILFNVMSVSVAADKIRDLLAEHHTATTEAKP